MKWDVCNFFHCYKDSLRTKHDKEMLQWGVDELRRVLTEAATMAHKAGNADLVDGFANLCIEPIKPPTVAEKSAQWWSTWGRKAAPGHVTQQMARDMFMVVLIGLGVHLAWKDQGWVGIVSWALTIFTVYGALLLIEYLTEKLPK